MHNHGRTGTPIEDFQRIVGATLTVVSIIFGAMLFTALVITWGRETSSSDAAMSNSDHWLAMASFQAAMVALTLVFCRFYGPTRDVLRLVSPRAPWPQFGRVVLWSLVVTTAVLAAYSLTAYIFFPAAVQQDLAVFQQLLVGVPLWLPAAVLVIGAPVSEELVFRGFLLGRLQQTRLGFAGAALVSAAGWTLLHLSYTVIGLIDVLLAGLLFSWCLWRTQTLWVPIAFHALYNAIVLAMISTTTV